MRRGRFMAGLLLGIVLTLSVQSLYLMLVEENKSIVDYFPSFHFRKMHYPQFTKKKQFSDSLSRLKQDSSFSLKNIVVDSAFYWGKWNELIAKPEYKEMDSLWIDSVIKSEYVLGKKNRKIDSTQIVKNVLVDKIKFDAGTVVLQINSQGDTSFQVLRDPGNQHVYVEFWSSPFKVNGYLFIPPVLQLYGYTRENIQKLVFYEDGVLIKIKDKWFYIKPSQQFQRFDFSFTASWLEKI